MSPTTEWRRKAEFFALMKTMKLQDFEDQCAVLLQLLQCKFTERIRRVQERGEPRCYGRAPQSTMYDWKYGLRHNSRTSMAILFFYSTFTH